MAGSKNIRFNQANSGEVTSIRVQVHKYVTPATGLELKLSLWEIIS